MYPLDRRNLAKHVYNIFSSLRKTAFILEVSHSTISRWLKEPRKLYNSENRLKTSKTNRVVGTLKVLIESDPFISIQTMISKLKILFNFSVSKELVRTIIKKQGISKKKARFYSKTNKLPDLTQTFLTNRNKFIEENRSFVSIDETSFGRQGRLTKGYSPVGKSLVIKKPFPRIDTLTCLAAVSREKVLKIENFKDSCNTIRFLQFLKDLALPPGTIFLFDNVKFHHSKEVKSLALERNWTLLYTPPYSPWFNPIEGVFSIVKREYYKNGLIKESWNKVNTIHLEAFFNKSLTISDNPLTL